MQSICFSTAIYARDKVNSQAGVFVALCFSINYCFLNIFLVILSHFFVVLMLTFCSFKILWSMYSCTDTLEPCNLNTLEALKDCRECLRIPEEKNVLYGIETGEMKKQ